MALRHNFKEHTVDCEMLKNKCSKAKLICGNKSKNMGQMVKEGARASDKYWRKQGCC